ncbi:hypothetical protein ACGYK5_17140 [Sulfitobacter sp. 1A16787]|uniref:head-tail connector protein n=1 Tax=Sulfitobacter sp. 1A16787 TaxID=3368571 RepID=UPI003745D473
MWGKVKVTTPPAALPLLVADVKRGLRIDHHEENEFLAQCQAAAVAMIDGPDGIGCAMMAQTWTLALDGFPAMIRLPGDNVREVLALRYLGRDLEWHAIPAEDFRLVTTRDPAVLVPAPGKSWPRPVDGIGTVEIEYTLGAEDRAQVSPSLLGALRLLTGHFYEHREALAVGVSVTELPLGVRHILDGHRRGWVA